MKKLLLTLLTAVMAVSAWAETATYTWTYSSSKFTVSASGDVPTGSSATLTSTYSSANQLTGSKAQTFTLTGYDDCTITGVSINMKRSSSTSAKANVTVSVGSTQIANVANQTLTTTQSDYDIPVTSTKVGTSEKVVITVSAAANSIYVYNYVITYTASGKTALGTATNLTESNITDRSATLSWDAVANATSYRVKVGTEEYDTNTNSYNLTGLAHNKEYNWSVKALAGGSASYSDGSYSASKNFTTSDFVLSAGTYNILPNNVFWGKDTQDGAKVVNANTGFGPVTECGITFEMNSNTSTNSYMKADHCRAYNGYTLTITAPDGYNLTAINFTGSTWVAPTANVGTMNSKKWTGCANEVTFTFSGTSYMSNIELTYIPDAVGVTITSAEYATFVAPYAMDFSEADVTAYAVTPNLAENKVTLTPQTEVPAGKAIVVKGTEGTHNVPAIASADDFDTALEVSATATPYDNVNTYYYLGQDNGVVGFRPLAEGGSIAAGKCFFKVAKGGSAPFLHMEIEGMEDGMQTGINLTPSLSEVEGACYDLYGRKSNGKGLMIQNGKVVLVK